MRSVVNHEPFASLKALIADGHRFAVSTHRSPDADSLGSAIAMHHLLRVLGKESLLFLPDPPAASLDFLVAAEPYASRLIRDPSGSFAPFDGLFLLDLATAKLLPPAFPTPDVTGPIVVIDHHAVHDDYGDIVVRDTSAAATGMVVAELAQELGLDDLGGLPHAALQGLYAAICSDTGGFRHSSTSADCLRLATELVERGVDPHKVARALFEQWPRPRFDLLMEALGSLRFEFNGRMSLMIVRRSTLNALNAEDWMVEGLVGFAQLPQGIEIAALLWQEKPRGDGVPRVRVSLRSTGNVRVSDIAVKLGGGGHVKAAGATVEMQLEEATDRLLAAARDSLHARPSLY